MQRALLLAALLSLVSACNDDGWQLVFEKLPAALTSVGGTSAQDVWAVGGDAGDGTGPIVLHYDGDAWTRRKTNTSGDLWWVHAFSKDLAFLGGANGTVLRVSKGSIEKLPTPASSGTVFGVWGSSPDDAWAVGGDGTSNAFAWHWNGSAWSEAPGFPADLKHKASLFKVWGRSRDDVFFVGGGGLVLHWDGTAFAQQAADLASSERSLFTVHGTKTLTVAVGGYASGALFEDDGTGWKNVAPAGMPQLSGVVLTETTGWAVGARASVFQRTSAGWQKQQTELETREDLHAVWVDPTGGVWAVGGEVLTLPLLRGVLLHKGGSVSDSIDE